MASIGARNASLDELMPVMREYLAQGQAIRLYPRGVSMRPLIREGKDSVTLSAPKEPLKLYDIALFCNEGRYILHRVIAKEQGTYVFCGDARRTLEIGITEQQLVAVVTSIRRGNRDIRRDSRCYRAYARRAVLKRRVWYALARAKRRLARMLRKP